MPSSARHPALLPLAFGAHLKARLSGLQEFAASLEESGYLVLDLAAMGATAPLGVETAFVNLNSVTLMAVS